MIKEKKVREKKINSKDKESWNGIKGYEGCYQISSFGKVESLARVNEGGRSITGRYLTPIPNSKGYLNVILYINKSKKVYKIHRLVAAAFISNPDNKSQVNHKNGDKADNRVENLEWATNSENQKHSYRVLGRIPTREQVQGEKCGTSKLKDREIDEIRVLLKNSNLLQKDIANRYGVRQQHISRIKSRKAWGINYD